MITTDSYDGLFPLSLLSTFCVWQLFNFLKLPDVSKSSERTLLHQRGGVVKLLMIVDLELCSLFPDGAGMSHGDCLAELVSLSFDLHLDFDLDADLWMNWWRLEECEPLSFCCKRPGLSQIRVHVDSNQDLLYYQLLDRRGRVHVHGSGLSSLHCLLQYSHIHKYIKKD